MFQSTINQLKPRKQILGLISGSQRSISFKSNEKDNVLSLSINTNQSSLPIQNSQMSPTLLSPSTSTQLRLFSNQTIQMNKPNETKSEKLISLEDKHLAHK